MMHVRRLLLSCVIVLPLLGIVGGGNRDHQVPVAADPVWTTSFEEDNSSHTDCSLDQGNPAVTVFGVADCDCDDAGDCTGETFPHGVELFRTPQNVYNATLPALEEGWVRWHFKVESTAGNSNAEIFNGLSGAGWPKVYINHSESIRIYCPNWISSGFTTSLTAGTWYIIEVHWWDYDNVDTTPDTSVAVYNASTLVEIGSSPVSCQGNTTSPGVDGIRMGAGNNHVTRVDCVQRYAADPGPVDTSVCNLRTD